LKENWSLTRENYRLGVSNAMRDICHGSSSLKKSEGPTFFDQHPLVGDRINKIILRQPSLRRLMGCPELGPALRHCEL
jgi:hypothetical protein